MTVLNFSANMCVSLFIFDCSSSICFIDNFLSTAKIHLSENTPHKSITSKLQLNGRRWKVIFTGRQLVQRGTSWKASAGRSAGSK